MNNVPFMLGTSLLIRKGNFCVCMCMISWICLCFQPRTNRLILLLLSYYQNQHLLHHNIIMMSQVHLCTLNYRYRQTSYTLLQCGISLLSHPTLILVILPASYKHVHLGLFLGCVVKTASCVCWM